VAEIWRATDEGQAAEGALREFGATDFEVEAIILASGVGFISLWRGVRDPVPAPLR
jgi:hypothetical protein